MAARHRRGSCRWLKLSRRADRLERKMLNRRKDWQYKQAAALAREIFAYRVAKYIGSYAAAMNGVDNIVFTAGVGENDSDIREEICSYLEFLGITIDEVKNREQGEAVRISDGTSRVNVLVIKTNEELEIAREAAELVNSLQGRPKM